LCVATCSTLSSSTECAGRTDVACATYSALTLPAPAASAAEQGLCVPACRSDAECGARQCDQSGPVATCIGGPDAGVVDAGQ
jgi:hypothetical protein